jgi:hypothetical protein
VDPTSVLVVLVAWSASSAALQRAVGRVTAVAQSQ